MPTDHLLNFASLTVGKIPFWLNCFDLKDSIIFGNKLPELSKLGISIIECFSFLF